MARGPTIRIPSIAGGVKGGDLADFARRVGKESVEVTVTFSAATAAVARHGMGRRYLGGVIIWQSAQHTQSISVVDPAVAEASGYDTSKYILVQAGSSGGATFTGNVRVWVL